MRLEAGFAHHLRLLGRDRRLHLAALGQPVGRDRLLFCLAFLLRRRRNDVRHAAIGAKQRVAHLIQRGRQPRPAAIAHHRHVALLRRPCERRPWASPRWPTHRRRPRPARPPPGPPRAAAAPPTPCRSRDKSTSAPPARWSRTSACDKSGRLPGYTWLRPLAAAGRPGRAAVLRSAPAAAVVFGTSTTNWQCGQRHCLPANNDGTCNVAKQRGQVTPSDASSFDAMVCRASPRSTPRALLRGCHGWLVHPCSCTAGQASSATRRYCPSPPIAAR